MALRYDYKIRVAADGTFLRLPIVPVLFTNPANQKKGEVHCLIDSGADDSFLRRQQRC
jgi:hypothetical protein